MADNAIIHDSEYYLSRAANHEAWAAEEADVGDRLDAHAEAQGRSG